VSDEARRIRQLERQHDLANGTMGKLKAALDAAIALADRLAEALRVAQDGDYNCLDPDCLGATDKVHDPRCRVQSALAAYDAARKGEP